MNVTALLSSTQESYSKPASGIQSAGQAAASATNVSASDFNLNSSSTVSLTYFSEDSAEFKAAYDTALKTRTGPSLAADDSIKTIEDRLGKFQRALSKSRPDLARANWDITVAGGKLRVTGDIKDDDKRAMEVRLNGDQALANAVQSYMGAAKSYLEASNLNSPFTGQNAYTGQRILYNFKDVAQQLEGKISFKELISTSWSMYNNPNGGAATDPGRSRGMSSLEILASRLVATPLT